MRTKFYMNPTSSKLFFLVHILKSVVSTATAIRNLDLKQKNVILERFGGHNFLTIRIIL